MKSKKRIKIIIVIILVITSNFLIYKSSNIKVAICSMAKKENLYIKEYVDYYIKLGIDHIFIYDDNDDNTEKISDIIISYTTCYNNNKDKFDFIFLSEIDEYLVIKNDTLKSYLSNKIFHKCDFIIINLILSTDNNLLYYEKKSLFERFKGPYLNSTDFKTFIRGNIKGLQYDIHSLSSSIRNISCNNIGKKYNFNIGKKYNFNKSDSKYLNDEFNYDKAYIIHYKYKSTEEFINKLKRDYNKWFDFNFYQ